MEGITNLRVCFFACPANSILLEQFELKTKKQDPPFFIAIKD
jgi:hypothetical protein